MSRTYLSFSLLLLALASATPTFAANTGQKQSRRTCSWLCCGRAAIEAVAATGLEALARTAAGDDVGLATFLVGLLDNFADAAFSGISRDVDGAETEAQRAQIFSQINRIAQRHALDPASLHDVTEADGNLVEYYRAQLPALNITIAAYADVLSAGQSEAINKNVTLILSAIATSEDPEMPFVTKTIAGLLNTQINAKLPMLSFETSVRILTSAPSARSDRSGVGLGTGSVHLSVVDSEADTKRRDEGHGPATVV